MLYLGCLCVRKHTDQSPCHMALLLPSLPPEPALKAKTMSNPCHPMSGTKQGPFPPRPSVGSLGKTHTGALPGCVILGKLSPFSEPPP